MALLFILLIGLLDCSPDAISAIASQSLFSVNIFRHWKLYRGKMTPHVVLYLDVCITHGCHCGNH